MANNFFEFEIDTSELEDFAERFKELTEPDLGIRLALEQVSRSYLNDLKRATPVDTGKLKKQWDIDNIGVQAKTTSDGWEITLINTTEYASYVEKGHHSYNQFGGPYVIKNRTVPYFDGESGATFVYGRFFVRKTENVWNEGKLDRSLQNRIGRWINETIKT